MYKEQSEEIGAVITNYFEGIYYGDVPKLESCFDPSLIIYGDMNNGVLYRKPLNDYLEGVRNRKSPNSLGEIFKMKITSIDLIGDVAVVKAHVPMLGYNYYDFLSLTKINGSWKIVNKLFAHVE